MVSPVCDARRSSRSHSRVTVLELTVNNRPGVLLRLYELFARQDLIVEGLLCLPLDNCRGRIWLLIGELQGIDQAKQQLAQLDDVIEVQRSNTDPSMFAQFGQLIQLSGMG
jgi:acetolactate synthase I/III small subunit